LREISASDVARAPRAGKEAGSTPQYQARPAPAPVNSL